jgi:integrase
MEQSMENVEGLEYVGELAKYLQVNMPGLSDISRESLEGIAQFVVFQRLARKLDFEVSIAGIDCKAEAVLFLENMGKKGSIETQKTYMRELKKLNAYCGMIKTRILEFTPQHADNYILYLINRRYSSASIALAVSVASSFCNFVERRHSDGVIVRFKNPFRGTRVKPKMKASKPVIVPTEGEVQYMLKRLSPKQAAMVALMSGLGLRCGALATLTIEGNMFTCYTKGKVLAGVIADDLLAFLKRRVKLSKLFIGMSVQAIKRSVNYHVGRLFEKGEIRACYSCHDFRHFFAIQEYGKDKDIWRVSRLLNHASLAATERYLKGLDRVE